MPRITPKETKRFTKIFNSSLAKLETPKNRLKPHWLTQHLHDLLLHKKDEMQELINSIIFNLPPEAIISEAYDNINLSLMIIDLLQQQAKEDSSK